MDATEWADYLIVKHGMEPIEADLAATTMEETTYNGYPAILITTPVTQSDTFDVIAQHGLAGQGAWLGFDYRTFFSDKHPYTLGQLAQPQPGDIGAAKGRITQYVQALNNAIVDENTRFPEQIRQIVKSRHDSIRGKNKQLDELSATAGIPLIKQTDISRVVPATLKIKRAIAPIMPPKPRPGEKRLVLERDKFDSIIELIDNQCRAFERTPSAYQDMGEERLRDIILGALNAVFAGAATGEAFSGLGKTDIHLRISQGEVFIAEAKIWGGLASLAEVVTQLVERLTWRDAFGVAIMFSRNADFGHVLQIVEARLVGLPGIVPGTLKKQGPNQFSARFTLPSDASSQVEVHVAVYNLFTLRQAGRTS